MGPVLVSLRAHFIGHPEHVGGLPRTYPRDELHVHVERLDDASAVIEPILVNAPAPGCRLTLLDGRAVLVAQRYFGDNVEAGYAYGHPGEYFDDSWLEYDPGWEVEVPGRFEASDEAWSGQLLDVDGHGRLLIEGRTRSVWSYDLAGRTILGPPIIVSGPRLRAARRGILHGREVLAVLTDLGFGLYDIATGQRRAAVTLGRPVWDLAMVEPDTVVVITEDGLTGFQV